LLQIPTDKINLKKIERLKLECFATITRAYDDKENSFVIVFQGKYSDIVRNIVLE
jgi:hypothetical protein